MMYLTLMVIALGTLLTRAIPFIFFKNREMPERLGVLIDMLPYATISLLVVYSLKDVGVHNLWATLIASHVCVGSYYWKENTVLSIAISTLIYMILI